jgi:hypothetical protein
MVGLQIPEPVDGLIREASSQFGRSVTESDATVADEVALAALAIAYKAANQLVRVYVDQMLRARHQRAPQLDTALGVWGCVSMACRPRRSATKSYLPAMPSRFR